MYSKTGAVVQMPSVFCPEDASWIQEHLLEFSPKHQMQLAAKYSEAYQKAFDAEPVSYKQMNRARFEANSRLRRAVYLYGPAADGLCKPAILVQGHQAKEPSPVHLLVSHSPP